MRKDLYHKCEDDCSHPLGDGVTVAEILAGEGPHGEGAELILITGEFNLAAFYRELASELDGRTPSGVGRCS